MAGLFTPWVLGIGWRRLAVRYRTDTQPGRWKNTGGAVAGVYYRGTLKMGVEPHGLYLEPIPVFNIFCPRLCIPWTAFARVGRRRNMFQGDRIELETADPKVRISLPAEDLEPARPYWPRFPS